MIESLALGNVRLFRGDSTKFHFKPLTVFCGTNSSGKSSILKTLLLLRQSQGIDEPITGHDGCLRFVGTQIDLGQYATFVSDRDTSLPIRLQIAVPIDLSKARFNFLVSKAKAKVKTPRALPSTAPRRCLLEVAFCFVSSRAVGHTSTSAKPSASHPHSDAGPRAVLDTADFRLSFMGQTLISWSVRRVKPTKGDAAPDYKLRLPMPYFENIGGTKVVSGRRLPKFKQVEMDVIIVGLLPFQILAKSPPKRKASSGAEEGGWHIIPLPPQINAAFFSIREALAKIHYIAPLRAPAKRYYVSHSDSAPFLDPAGEFMPFLLAKEKKPMVTCFIPRGKSLQKLSLDAALDAWLFYLRTGEVRTTRAGTNKDFHVASTKGVLVELEIASANDGKQHALADSGFGYSQLLPILVRGLLAEKGSTIIIEQPELHLNPALQVRLVDFFVSLANTDKQVLIETHSEHIVNATRVAIAEEEDGGALASHCAIFFIQSGVQGPHVLSLAIDADGCVVEWPHEFFGEAVHLAGRLLRAQKTKRSKIAK